MNKRLLKRAFQQQYRKRALIISVIVHVILALTCAFFFVTAVVQETEDEIQVELISELPRQQVVKKKTVPIPKKEEPPPKLKEEMPIPKEVPIEKKKITLEKKVDVIQPEHKVAVAKMPAKTPVKVELQSAAVKKMDVDIPAGVEAPDLSTDADLTPDPESIVAPIGDTDIGDTAQNYARRRETGVRTPGKGVGKGIGDRIKSTGTSKGKSIGEQTTGNGEGNDTFSSIIQQLADDIIGRSGGAPIDVVFVVDASGSMGDNINAVAEHLGLMIDAYKASEIDYQLGLTHFSADQKTQNNKISVSQLTTSLQTYKQMLYAIIPTGDENALDAIHQTVTEMQFRANTVKHFILVTDEPFTSWLGFTVDNTINLCQQNEIYVNVLGLNMPEHKRMAKETDGTWHAVPQDPIPQHIAQQPKTVQDIGKKILREAVNLPTDIVLFVDTSKSMENRMQYITEQIDLWIRDWDNAMIDYRIGVVRFRASGTVNMVNVYNPPQTTKQIHKILALPLKDDENLFHAIVEGIKRTKTRANAKTHFILITDEPGNPKQPIAGTISLLKEKPVVVSVIGTIDTFQQQVAQQTGGIWVAMPNAHKVNKTYH
ncbi:MAG: VWA domain-containing protein [Candidatus Poribacteria bacterium]|nr:VWA domain-containing protein [Candidatus Poribacteria bacterium]